MNARRIALLGILTAIAIVLAIVESFIPSIGIPGVKLGLANIVILIALYELGVIDAVIINLLRVVVASLVRGTFLSTGFLMSFTGAFLSLLVMALFHQFIKKFSIVGVSVIGSLFHIFGQVLIAMLYLSTPYVLYYLPLIAISAIITGVLVGISANLIIKTGVIKKQREKYHF